MIEAGRGCKNHGSPLANKDEQKPKISHTACIYYSKRKKKDVLSPIFIWVPSSSYTPYFYCLFPLIMPFLNHDIQIFFFLTMTWQTDCRSFQGKISFKWGCILERPNSNSRDHHLVTSQFCIDFLVIYTISPLKKKIPEY